MKLIHPAHLILNTPRTYNMEDTFQLIFTSIDLASCPFSLPCLKGGNNQPGEKFSRGGMWFPERKLAPSLLASQKGSEREKTSPPLFFMTSTSLPLTEVPFLNIAKNAGAWTIFCSRIESQLEKFLVIFCEMHLRLLAGGKGHLTNCT